jgi:integrase/recombinase XerD
VSTLAGQLDDYLRLRRGLGFQLGQHGSVLPGFVAYAAASGAGTVTVESAVTWARLSAGPADRPGEQAARGAAQVARLRS